jgi:hypothetical protein
VTRTSTEARRPGIDIDRSQVRRILLADPRGDRLPYALHPTPDGESGRGLLLVDALADRWGVAHGPAPRKTATGSRPAARRCPTDRPDA